LIRRAGTVGEEGLRVGARPGAELGDSLICVNAPGRVPRFHGNWKRRCAIFLAAGGHVDALTGMVFMALIATIAALAIGVVSMAGGGSYDARHSHHWMMLRVAFQAVAVALVLVVALMQAA
jgi:hypothetical protein